MNQRSIPILSIIVPAYNEELIIEQTYNSLISVLNSLIDQNKISSKSYLCFVDDGSSDKTWQKINSVSALDSKVKGIKLSCNIGHQKALLAGICENSSDIYISIDCDLQDDINCIPQMVEYYLQNDIEVVYGVRNSRTADSFIKRFLASSYYKIISFLGIKCIREHADFRLITERIAKILRNSSAENLYMRGFIYSLGFPYKTVSYPRLKRIGGFSKYTLRKSLKLALDGFIEFSLLPIYLIFIMAFFFFIISIVQKSMVVFGFSMNFIVFGIISVYLSRIYSSLKHKSNYVISEKINY